MDLKEISQKRQKKWKETDVYKVKEDTSQPKFYILDMFPYPSGSALHVGHPKGYIATDILARKKMLQGFNVLHPMGFDTFGLGTEQYAIEHKMKPQDVSKQNIEKFISQLESFGTTYDRSRSVNTADPKYFKRTQRIFLQMYNHYYDEKLKKAMPITDPSKQERLAYVDYKPINRCPHCMTGLANEDLDDGKCERCGSEVEQKPMKQRVLRITKYADRLLEGLNDLQRDESMKDLERNWIGKSEGTEFDMVIASEAKQSGNKELKFSVYTTRVDTVFGMSFVAIAPEHPLVDKITTAEYKAEVDTYKEAAKHKTQLERTELQKDKSGVFCGAYAINPFNGEKVKIFVADYVLANYGTGVVMAVPAHDERDFEFAKKYDLPITEVIIKGPHPEPFSSKLFLPKNKKEFSLYQRIDKDIVQFTKNLRKKQTPAEEFFWEFVRNNTLGLKFRRQHPFGRYIVDFYCHELKLVIEIDGSIHDIEENKRRDKQREEDLKIEGLYIMRFTNDELFDNPQKILEKIIEYKNKIFPRLEGEGMRSHASLDSAFTEKGTLIDSREFSGLQSDEAIKKMQAWLEEKGIGGVKINYRMQDRVFSRQRYRGEPIPVVRTKDEPKISINFYEQKTWKAIVDGKKTIETRALNPEEPERYFGDVKVDDIIKFINKKTKEALYIKVTKVYNWNNLNTLWEEDKNIIEKIYTNKETFVGIKTIEEFKKGRDFQTGYIDKIEKYGLVGREFEIIKPTKKIIALDEKDLPLELPDVENYEPTGTEEGPLANITERVNITLPDGTKAKRETNTMPGRAGSSRYWLRYMDVNNNEALVGKDKEKYRGNVDVYVGGAEHITRHIIYGRFWQKFLFDIGVVSKEEPFQAYHSVGLIMGEDGRKMSKRRGNVVNPDDIINEFGTDVLRAYEMFMGPFDQSIAWSTNGIKGIKKFLDKIILLKNKISDAEETNETKILLNQSIKKLTEDIDGFRFNTAISQLMILVNHLTECTTITKKTFEDLVILVSPFAPHLAEELREQLGNDYSVFTKATWPIYDKKCLVADTITIAVQINGKVRGTLCISKEAEEKEVMDLAKSDKKISAWIVNEPKKVIYVKGKILNIVV